jgi:hypothetical protein
MLLFLMACNGSEDPRPTGDGVFEEGCPVNDVVSRQIGVQASLPGDVAVGGEGDWLVANEYAAFVISSPDKFDGPRGTTYWYYGGAVIDAVAMDGCSPANEDTLDEVGLVVASIDLGEVSNSNVRAFQGTRVEPIEKDGRVGVRVHGSDAMHWLVEYTLIDSTPGRPVGGPLNVGVAVDYTLEPGSPVLQIDTVFTNNGDEDLDLVTAALFSFAPSIEEHAFSPEAISIGGQTFETSIPWMVGASEKGSLGYGVEDGNLSYFGVSGVTILADATQALNEPISVKPGESEGRTAYLSVGAGGGPTATLPLAACNDEPLLAGPVDLTLADGIIQGPAGPIAGAEVRLEASDGDGWGVLDVAWTDDAGRYRVGLPAYDWEYRLYVIAAGWEEAEIEVGDHSFSEVAGAVSLTVADTEGGPQAARLVFENDTGQRTFWVRDEETIDLPVGTWEFTATRGYEYTPHTGTLVVGDASATLDIVLEHSVDTTGWMSVDTHVHSSDSTDSDILPQDQLLRAAAHGLEVVVFTEHENVVDRTSLPVEHGLDEWTTCITGEEVTASLPEHLTLFPVIPDGTPRGGPVDWYGLPIDEIFNNMRDRSPGGVSMMNHPSWLGSIGWDITTAQPTITDPTLFGLDEGDAVWDWNMDGLEVMNGHGNPFSERFGYWQSMLNAGYPMTATGCSDTHGGDDMGFPRSYFRSTTDDPAAFDLNDLVGSYHIQDVVMSAGAFARVSASEPVDGVVDLSVHIEAIPQADISHFVVFVNCDTALSVAATDPEGIVKFSDTVQVPIEGDSTITLAAFGYNALPSGLPQYNATKTPRVMTNALWVDADGDGALDAPGPRDCAIDVSAPD